MNQKIENERIIRAKDLQKIQTYFYLYHRVYMDTRVHIGVVSNFNIGVLTAKYSKQKIN